jgi:hypothetical protein
MKLKSKPFGRTEVEFDEFYKFDDVTRPEIIQEIAENFRGNRTAYNRWEFPNRKKAEEFVFVYKLKYANNESEEQV